MKNEPPEIRVFVVGWAALTGKEKELSKVSINEYTVENLQRAMFEAVSMADRSVGCAELPLLRPQVSVWLRSDRGLRARMVLRADVIQRISGVGATIDFDPYMYEGMEYLRADAIDAWEKPPEISVVIVGSDPGTGEERWIASSTCEEYSFENVELLIYDTLRDAGDKVGADSLPRWAPRVVVQPTLCRDDRPSMHFTAALIRRMAEAGASLEFDPSVDDAIDDHSSEVHSGDA